jgi:hypothetical protein
MLLTPSAKPDLRVMMKVTRAMFQNIIYILDIVILKEYILNYHNLINAGYAGNKCVSVRDYYCYKF